MKILIIFALILIVASVLIIDFLEHHEYVYSIVYRVHFSESAVREYNEEFYVCLSEEQSKSTSGYYLVSENGVNKLLRMDKSVVFMSTSPIEIVKIEVKRK